MNDVKRTMVSLPVHYDSHTTQVPASGYNDKIPDVKLDEVGYFSTGDVYADRVVDFDEGVRVSYCPAIMRHAIRNLLQAKLYSLHFAKLVLCVCVCVCVCKGRDDVSSLVPIRYLKRDLLWPPQGLLCEL